MKEERNEGNRGKEDKGRQNGTGKEEGKGKESGQKETENEGRKKWALRGATEPHHC